MQPEIEARLTKVRKISGFLRFLCVLYMLSCAWALYITARGPIFHHGPYWGIGTAWYTYGGVEFKVYSLLTRETGDLSRGLRPLLGSRHPLRH